MPVSRRTFLIALAVSALSVGWYRFFKGKPEDELQTVLPDFLDTLIPADQTPSATELDVDREINQYLDTQPNYRNIVMFGCLWLNKQAQARYSSNFAALSLEQRTTIVTALESMKDNQTAQFFFQLAKDKAFEFYYSKPQSWSGLGIQQPPQPLGYRDYDQAPDRAS